MYRVVKLYGTEEPWWFFEDWKKNIVSVEEFDDFYQALKAYKKEWFDLAAIYEEYKSQEDLLSAFWQDSDQEWCEECAGYLQRYHGLALLDGWEQIPEEKNRKGYRKRFGKSAPKYCTPPSSFKE